MLICVAPGCEDIAVDGGPHCLDHAEATKARNREARQTAKAGSGARKGSALYGDRAWRAASRRFLERHPTCADCGELGVVVAAEVVDHRLPHRGDRRLFWDRQNWQPLCTSCHNRKTAREVWHGGAGRKS